MLRTNMMPVDTEGFAIPWAEDDRVIECGFDDPAWGEPESWPEWTDRWTFEEGLAIPADAEILPPELEPYEPSEDDLADYAAWSDRLDALARLAELDDACDRLAGGWIGTGRMTDQDVASNGI